MATDYIGHISDSDCYLSLILSLTLNRNFQVSRKGTELAYSKVKYLSGQWFGHHFL